MKFACLVACLGPSLAGCGSGDETTDSGSGGATAAPCGGRGETYSAGMRHATTQGLYLITLAEAAPAPPARFKNDWKLMVTTGADGSSTAVDSGDVQATPWMVDHGHGGTIIDSTLDTGGVSRLTGINLFMPGLWQVTLDVKAAPGDDGAKFEFCIAD